MRMVAVSEVFEGSDLLRSALLLLIIIFKNSDLKAGGSSMSLAVVDIGDSEILNLLSYCAHSDYDVFHTQ